MRANGARHTELENRCETEREETLYSEVDRFDLAQGARRRISCWHTILSTSQISIGCVKSGVGNAQIVCVHRLQFILARLALAQLMVRQFAFVHIDSLRFIAGARGRQDEATGPVATPMSTANEIFRQRLLKRNTEISVVEGV